MFNCVTRSVTVCVCWFGAMDEASTTEAEPVAAPPTLGSLKKTGSQRSFKEGLASRRASFEPQGVPSTITEESNVPDFDSAPAPAPAAFVDAPTASPVESKPKPRPAPKKSTAASVSSRDNDSMSLDSKQSSIMLRSGIRDYIRNERDTILRKNMALYETLKSEDNRREQFQQRQLKTVGREIPVYVQKLIRNVKRSVHRTMREKGGTPFSIIRGMFLHWDGQKNGALSFDNFRSCLNHLGVIIPLEDQRNIFNYYSKTSGSGDARMGYDELLADIQFDEPSVLEFVEATQQELDEREDRFEEHHDKFDVMPEIVKNFIEALRNEVMKKMRAEGGTLYYHVTRVFGSYDFDNCSAQFPDELYRVSRKKFNLSLSLHDCQKIVKFYDRKGGGVIDHRQFISDICAGLAPILHFEEQTATSIENAKQKLVANPFIKKTYKPPSNRVLEKLKDAVHNALDYRLFKVGGSYKSWINEAFAFWDPKATGKFTSWQSLQGAIARLGVNIPESECRAIMSLFDADNRGEFSYTHLLNSLLEGDLGLLADPPRQAASERQAQLQMNHPLLKAKAALMQQDLAELAKVKHPPKLSATARAPRMVSEYVNKIKHSVDVYVLKSKGTLNARDILHGTFLRFDPQHTSKVSNDKLSAVLRELGVRIKDRDIEAFVAWFDCDGSRTFDYNELTRQIYGYASTDTDMSRSLPFLPSINHSPSHSGAAALSMSPSKPLMQTLPTIPEKSVNDNIPSNLRPKETKVVKEARMRAQRERLLEQRKKVAERIESIEIQRKKIVEDYRARHSKEKY